MRSEHTFSGQGEEKALTLLQKRFITSGFEGLNDQEAIKLLLSLVLTPQESEQLAKKCFEEFGNLREFVAASPQELQQVGLNLSCIFCIRLLRELPVEVLKEKILDKPVYGSSQDVFNYLYYSMRDLKREVFKVIYLNNRNQIIDTADLFEGVADAIAIRPREIIETAIANTATILLFAHNHPTGDPHPSKSDKQLTRDLVFVGMILQIKVLDHIIIGENTHFSFADEGLIQKYEDDFLNIKIRHVSEPVLSY